MCLTSAPARSRGPHPDRRAAALAASLGAALLAACSGDQTPSAPAAPAGPSPARVTVTDSTGRGVGAVRVALDSGSAAVTDSAGVATFPTVAAGTHPIALGLPLGYDTVAGQPTSLTVAAGPAALAIRVRALTTVTHTLKAGVPDTLSLANGVSVVALSATGTGPPVTVRAVDPRTLPGGTDLATPFEVSFGGGGAPALAQFLATGGAGGNLRANAAAVDGITLTMMGPLPPGATDAVFAANVGTASAPVLLTANATSTTVTMPNGRTRTVALQTATVSPTPMTQFFGIARADAACVDPDIRYLKPLDGGPPTMPPSDTRRPLILVHGWQPTVGFVVGPNYWCDAVKAWAPETATWKQFLAAFAYDVVLKDQYRVFVYRYPTFEHIQRNADWLDSTLQARGLDQRAVVLAHSMGGLVTRGVFARRVDAGRLDPIQALITLSTPHEGSPLANWVPSGSNSDRPWSLIPNSPGLRDLRPTSQIITALKQRVGDGPRVFAFGGIIGANPNPAERAGSLVLKNVMRAPVSDGIVPIESSLPSWTTLQTRLPDRDHEQMTGGEQVYGKVREVLAAISDDCEVPPAPLARNDFPLSGSIARQAGSGTIVATINPITIGGSAVTDVKADNFRVVENGCAKRLTLTRGSGAPVDLVFIQDLSTSMTNAIAGVRASVARFAASLAAQGLDVRFASVAFSGGGLVPTSPGGAPAEFLGPIQNFTGADAFQRHVATWQVGGDAAGNVDLAENPLEAIEYAHQNLSWRDGAARAYILITDAAMHVAGDVCDRQGPCTDETPQSLLALLGTSAVIHVVSPASPGGFGANPAVLATGTGGQQVVLPAFGNVDLSATGLAQTMGRTIRLTYASMTSAPATQRLRLVGTFAVGGRTYNAELSPGLVASLERQASASGRADRATP